MYVGATPQCHVCVTNPVYVPVEPCGHYSLCTECYQFRAEMIEEENMTCPICGMEVTNMQGEHGKKKVKGVKKFDSWVSNGVASMSRESSTPVRKVDTIDDIDEFVAEMINRSEKTGHIFPWDIYFDDQTESNFYFNIETKEIQYEAPTEVEEEEAKDRLKETLGFDEADEGLGDEFEETEWVAPSFEKGMKARALHVFLGGNGGCCRSVASELDKSSVGVSIYFRSLRIFILLFFLLTIIYLFPIGIFQQGKAVPARAPDATGISRISLGNLGLASEATLKDFGHDVAAWRPSIPIGNQTLLSNETLLIKTEFDAWIAWLSENLYEVSVFNQVFTKARVLNTLVVCEILGMVLAMCFYIGLRVQVSQSDKHSSQVKISATQYTVFVRYLPYDVTEEELCDHFHNLFAADTGSKLITSDNPHGDSKTTETTLDSLMQFIDTPLPSVSSSSVSVKVVPVVDSSKSEVAGLIPTDVVSPIAESDEAKTDLLGDAASKSIADTTDSQVKDTEIPSLASCISSIKDTEIPSLASYISSVKDTADKKVSIVFEDEPVKSRSDGEPAGKEIFKALHAKKSMSVAYRGEEEISLKGSWVADVQIARPIGDTITTFLHAKLKTAKLREQRALVKMYSPGTSFVNGQNPGRRAKAFDQVQKIGFEINSMLKKAKLDGKKVEKSKHCGAFVTFNEQLSQHRCLEAYSGSSGFLGYYFQPAELRFRRLHRIEVAQASNPTDVIWENIEVSDRTRFIRRQLTCVATVLVLLVSAVIVLVAQAVRGQFVKNLPQLSVCQATLPATVVGGHDLLKSALLQSSQLSTVLERNPDLLSRAEQDQKCGNGKFYVGYLGILPSRTISYSADACSPSYISKEKVGLNGIIDPDSSNFSTGVTTLPSGVFISDVACPDPRKKQQCPCLQPRTSGRCRTLECYRPDLQKLTVPTIPCTDYPVSTLSGCYCLAAFESYINKQGVVSGSADFFDKEGSFCSSWLQGFVAAQTLAIVAGLTASIINQILVRVLPALVDVEKHVSESQKSYALISKIFTSQFINMGIIVLLLNARLPGNPYIPIITEVGILQGDHDDFTTAWYASVGATIAVSLISSAIIPHLYPLYAYCSTKRIRAKLKDEITDKGRYPTQALVNEFFVGPSMEIETRLSGTLVTIFVAMTYGTGMPILFPIAMVSLLLYYVVDRSLLLRYYAKPKEYSANISNLMVAAIPWAITLHGFIAIWMLTRDDLFQISSTIDASLNSESNALFAQANSLLNTSTNTTEKSLLSQSLSGLLANTRFNDTKFFSFSLQSKETDTGIQKLLKLITIRLSSDYTLPILILTIIWSVVGLSDLLLEKYVNVVFLALVHIFEDIVSFIQSCCCKSHDDDDEIVQEHRAQHSKRRKSRSSSSRMRPLNLDDTTVYRVRKAMISVSEDGYSDSTEMSSKSLHGRKGSKVRTLGRSMSSSLRERLDIHYNQYGIATSGWGEEFVRLQPASMMRKLSADEKTRGWRLEPASLTYSNGKKGKPMMILRKLYIPNATEKSHAEKFQLFSTKDIEEDIDTNPHRMRYKQTWEVVADEGVFSYNIRLNPEYREALLVLEEHVVDD